MSPEGIALIVAVFWGLTAIWLAYRTARGRRGQHPLESFTERSNGLWLCGTCLSLNRRDMNFCYNCRRAKGFSGRRTPGELPVSRGVPVMAEGIAGGQTPGELPVSRGVPVMAEGSAGSSVEDAGTTVAPATPRNAPPAPEILVVLPSTSCPLPWSGHPRACPFVRFWGSGTIPRRGTTSRTPPTFATRPRGGAPHHWPPPDGSSPAWPAPGAHSRSPRNTRSPTV
jgi:hypothetical protein